LDKIIICENWLTDDTGLQRLVFLGKKSILACIFKLNQFRHRWKFLCVSLLGVVTKTK